MAIVMPREENSVPFAISGTSAEGELLITLTGELDVAARAQVDAFVRCDVPSVPRRLVLDMAGVTFVDSTGLSMVIRASRTVAGAGGEVVIRRPPAQFLRLLEMTSTDRLVTIEPATDA